MSWNSVTSLLSVIPQEIWLMLLGPINLITVVGITTLIFGPFEATTSARQTEDGLGAVMPPCCGDSGGCDAGACT